jgi:hypothetical protein
MLLPWEEIRELPKAGNTVGEKCRNGDCSWQKMPLILKVMQESTPQEIYPGSDLNGCLLVAVTGL